MSIGSCLDNCSCIISCLQDNFGEAFKDTRPWNALSYVIKVAEAAGNSLQVIANFQRQCSSDQRRGYFMCELCRVMPQDDRPSKKHCHRGGWSCLSCGERYCAEHLTEHHGICNPEIKGDIKVPDQAYNKRAEQAAAPKTCLFSQGQGCRGKQPLHYGLFKTCNSCRVIDQKRKEKMKPGKRQKTAEESLTTKEAKLINKKATDLAAFQEDEDLLRADTEANHESLVRMQLALLSSTEETTQWPYKMCLLCRTKAAAQPSQHDRENKKANNSRAYQKLKKRKLKTTMQGQTKLSF